MGQHPGTKSPKLPPGDYAVAQGMPLSSILTPSTQHNTYNILGCCQCSTAESFDSRDTRPQPPKQSKETLFSQRTHNNGNQAQASPPTRPPEINASQKQPLRECRSFPPNALQHLPSPGRIQSNVPLHRCSDRRCSLTSPNKLACLLDNKYPLTNTQ